MTQLNQFVRACHILEGGEYVRRTKGEDRGVHKDNKNRGAP